VTEVTHFGQICLPGDSDHADVPNSCELDFFSRRRTLDRLLGVGHDPVRTKTKTSPNKGCCVAFSSGGSSLELRKTNAT
jgi:hypothetical protein